MKNILLALAMLGALGAFAADKKPVKVFILAGQSNMEGKGGIDPLLNHQIKAPDTKEFFAHFHEDGEYIKREDVWINFLNRRGRIEIELDCLGAQHLHKLVMDDLNDLLTGRNRPEHFGPDRLFLHPRDEILHHRQRHIGFQERDAHFAHGLDHVGGITYPNSALILSCRALAIGARRSA